MWHRGQRNRTGRPGLNPHVCGQLIDDKASVDIHERNDSLLNKLPGRQNNRSQKRTLDTIWTTHKTNPNPQLSTSSLSFAGPLRPAPPPGVSHVLEASPNFFLNFSSHSGSCQRSWGSWASLTVDTAPCCSETTSLVGPEETMLLGAVHRAEPLGRAGRHCRGLRRGGLSPSAGKPGNEGHTHSHFRGGWVPCWKSCWIH